MRTTFINSLIELAENDKNLILLTADMGFGVFERFKEKYPNQYYNVGIAEQNLIGVAAGLAMTGKKVYVYSIIPFLTMRAYEQIRIDICYHNLDIKLIGVGGGLAYGPAGATHHSIEDLGIMRVLPNMKVFAPGDPIEAKEIFLKTYSNSYPCYIRLSKNNEPIINEKKEIFLGKANPIVIGEDIALLTCGNMLELSKKIVDITLKDHSKKISLYSFHTIKPIDEEKIKEIINKYTKVLILEEHNVYGGLYSAFMEVVGRNIDGIKTKSILPFGIKDTFSHYVGSQDFIRECYGLTRKKIIKEIVSNR
ncbi:MAG: transketolase C-terminal domain-containing protein [Cetobacterium sp.]|uniref:transketolase family protein n=1 Tax=Cetobacterium sp. TaxID=2071632 RepID=UPI002FCC670E